MSAFLIVTYDVSNPERFADYNPGQGPAIRATIEKHGGSLLAAGPAEAMEGACEQVCVTLKFPDADAARAWLADDEYAPLKAIRYESTSNIREFIVNGF